MGGGSKESGVLSPGRESLLLLLAFALHKQEKVVEGCWQKDILCIRGEQMGV
jgi:hypothetical protein